MRLLSLFAASLAAGSAWAADPAPADPPAAPPYRSAFTDYRTFKSEPLVSWREANDEMGRVGGMMGHMGHGASPTPPEPAMRHGPEEDKAGADPHAGHRGGGGK